MTRFSRLLYVWQPETGSNSYRLSHRVSLQSVYCMTIERGRGIVGVFSGAEGPVGTVPLSGGAWGNEVVEGQRRGAGAPQPGTGTGEITTNNNRTAWSYATVGTSHECRGRSNKTDKTIETRPSRKVSETPPHRDGNEGEWNLTDWDGLPAGHGRPGGGKQAWHHRAGAE